MQLKELDSLANKYAHAHEELFLLLREYKKSVDAIHSAYFPQLRKAADVVKVAEAKLKLGVEDSRDLFVDPRSMMLWGVKFGFRKQKGKIVWDDPDEVVERLRKQFAADAEQYIRTTFRPDSAALNRLPVGDLRKLGVRVVEDTDAVFVTPARTHVDKEVEALLREPAPEKKQ